MSCFSSCEASYACAALQAATWALRSSSPFKLAFTCLCTTDSDHRRVVSACCAHFCLLQASRMLCSHVCTPRLLSKPFLSCTHVGFHWCESREQHQHHTCSALMCTPRLLSKPQLPPPEMRQMILFCAAMPAEVSHTLNAYFDDSFQPT